jgi:hypothetical protein
MAGAARVLPREEPCMYECEEVAGEVSGLRVREGTSGREEGEPGWKEPCEVLARGLAVVELARDPGRLLEYASGLVMMLSGRLPGFRPVDLLRLPRLAGTVPGRSDSGAPAMSPIMGCSEGGPR